MSRYLAALLAFVVFLLGPSTGPAGEAVRVTGDRVNLRAAPTNQAEVVMQVSRGDVLSARSPLTNEWVEVVPPEEVSVWVYGDLLQENEVVADKVNVRCGPGINYRSVAVLNKGHQVLIRGKFGPWIKIAAPTGCSLWISGRYLEAAPSPAAEEFPPRESASGARVREQRPSDHAVVQETERQPQVEQDSVRSDRRAVGRVPEDPLAGKALLSSRAQGAEKEVLGVLSAAPLVWNRPSKFQIVKRDAEGRLIFSCFVVGNEERLQSLQGRTLLISGKEYWLQGVRSPVVVAERIAVKE